MIGFLHQPYPFEHSTKKSLSITLGATLFVTFFLFLFQPFGLHVYDGMNFFLICLEFGLATGAVMAISYFLVIPLFPKIFNEENWTVIKHICWVMVLLISIAIANTFLIYLIDIGTFSWQTLLVSVGQVMAIGIIITTLFVSLDYLRHFKTNQREAKKLDLSTDQSSHSTDTISLFSENENEQLHLKADELFYLTSADNYVEVVYQSEKKITQKLLRGTLQKAEKQINYPDIIRCHRSYIVNLQKVVSVNGNAQGYQLGLREINKIIPVSRSCKKAVLKRLKKD